MSSKHPSTLHWKLNLYIRTGDLFKTQSLQLLPPPPSPAWNERKPANWQWPFLFTHSKLIPEFTVMQLLCRVVERFALKSLSSSFLFNCRTDPSVSQKHHPGVLQSGKPWGGPFGELQDPTPGTSLDSLVNLGRKWTKEKRPFPV